MEVLAYQIVIFLIIYINGYFDKTTKNLITLLAVAFTIVMVFTTGLAILQFLTIFIAYAISPNKVKENEKSTNNSDQNDDSFFDKLGATIVMLFLVIIAGAAIFKGLIWIGEKIFLNESNNASSITETIDSKIENDDVVKEDSYHENTFANSREIDSIYKLIQAHESINVENLDEPMNDSESNITYQEYEDFQPPNIHSVDEFLKDYMPSRMSTLDETGRASITFRNFHYGDINADGNEDVIMIYGIEGVGGGMNWSVHLLIVELGINYEITNYHETVVYDKLQKYSKFIGTDNGSVKFKINQFEMEDDLPIFKYVNYKIEKDSLIKEEYATDIN
jgi:hypothetical protein